MMSLTKRDWVALRSKRAAISAALQKAEIPIMAWTNEEPEFSRGYEPDWDKIIKIINVIVKTDALSQRGEGKSVRKRVAKKG